MNNDGKITTHLHNGVATISFYHPKSNSLTKKLLKELTAAVDSFAKQKNAKVIVLRSEGNKTFCAGASFDELLEINDFKTGKDFFMGFARLINAMRKCPKFIIARIQGKCAGGGVGIAAAADYTLASSEASVRLSELALGIGPFVVGPAVERKIGSTNFITMSIDAEWHDAFWAKNAGLFTKVFATIDEVDDAVSKLASKIAGCNPEAIEQLKKVFWHGTESWDKLLEERAEISGKLVLSDFTKKYIQQFKTNK
ncbi:enoyl-CoA hydratase/isomerase family protein [Melioribacteraceae bacterium 4301-Me]|uniref:enoyl-CoA hydratase/isomerase family protein n=1 Tax=Pyranulibacter aquaticus TaxID=3163344 RepID=UPI003597AE7A